MFVKNQIYNYPFGIFSRLSILLFLFALSFQINPDVTLELFFKSNEVDKGVITVNVSELGEKIQNEVF